jgi:hypothetical protein
LNEVPKKKRTRRNNKKITPVYEVSFPIVDNQREIRLFDSDIHPFTEMKEDIPFYDEYKEITDFITRVHVSEPAFPIREYDNEHP